jgi:MFS transporter, ACS family, hexuronate transporter
MTGRLHIVASEPIGILGPKLTEEFHWTESHFSLIVSIFTLAYAVSYMAAGRMMDWIGERKGFALAVAVWSAAAMAHGLVSPLVYFGLPWINAVLAGTFLGSLTPMILSVAGFSVARFALGLAEGGNFPGAMKTVGLWHPKSELCRPAFSTVAATWVLSLRHTPCRLSSNRCNGAGPPPST